MRLLAFWIPGRSRATQTGSSVRAGDRIYAKQRNTDWSAYCALVAKTHKPARLFDGPLEVHLWFIVRRPKKALFDLPIKRPDLDNLFKGLLDRWKGILYYEDSLITDVLAHKRYTTRDVDEGLWVEIHRPAADALPAGLLADRQVQLALEAPLRGLATLRGAMHLAGLEEAGHE